jgi:amino acid transporter
MTAKSVENENVGVVTEEIGQGEQHDNFTNGPSSTTMKRGLKPRHSQMIAMGACVGTGLFIGTGATLAKGGPVFILVGYSLLALLVYCIVTAAVEVAAYLPISGWTMSYYGSRNVSNSLGFAMGWLYFYSYGILLPTEITAAGLVIDYWNS